MLALCQGGTHQHQAGDGRLVLLAAGEAPVGLRTGRTQAEPSPHHTRVAVNCGLQGHTQVSPPGLAWQEAASSGDALEYCQDGRRTRARRSLLLCDIPHRYCSSEREQLELSWAGDATHLLIRPQCWGGQHLLVCFFCTCEA